MITKTHSHRSDTLCRIIAGGNQGLACLREMPSGLILQASPYTAAPFWDPVGDADVDVANLPTRGRRQGALLLIDGLVIPESGWKAFGNSDLLADVPLMVRSPC